MASEAHSNDNRASEVRGIGMWQADTIMRL
jgi:hypothetical protein